MLFLSLHLVFYLFKSLADVFKHINCKQCNNRNSCNYLVRQNLKSKKRRPTYPKDKVILHQFPRGLHAPSASPFALKLETWLRMANVSYINEFSYQMSNKGKVPWITLNNEVV